MPGSKSTTCPWCSQRTRSVLTFFAQDATTHNLIYANADLTKATANNEVLGVPRPLARCHRRRPRSAWSSMGDSPPRHSSPGSTNAACRFLTLRTRAPTVTQHLAELQHTSLAHRPSRS